MYANNVLFSIELRHHRMRTSSRWSENDRTMNGSKNNRPSITTTTKTLVPCSSASARVMLWEVGTSVHSRVHAWQDNQSFSRFCTMHTSLWSAKHNKIPFLHCWSSIVDYLIMNQKINSLKIGDWKLTIGKSTIRKTTIKGQKLTVEESKHHSCCSMSLSKGVCMCTWITPTHVCILMYACGQHAKVYTLKLKCTENVRFVLGDSKTALTPYPPFEIPYVFFICVNLWDPP